MERERSMLFEIVYDRALRQALFFSAFSFLPAVRGVRLHSSLRSVNILPPCSFSSSFISSSYTWINHEGTADRRPRQGCCHRYVSLFYALRFLFLVLILNLLFCYICLICRTFSRFLALSRADTQV